MPSRDGNCLDTPPGTPQPRLKALTARTFLARFTDHRDVPARIGEQRGFVKTAPWIRPAQHERSLSMAPKDFRPALQDVRPEHRLRALRMRPSHNRTGTAASNLRHDGWTEPGAPAVPP